MTDLHLISNCRTGDKPSTDSTWSDLAQSGEELPNNHINGPGLGGFVRDRFGAANSAAITVQQIGSALD